MNPSKTISEALPEAQGSGATPTTAAAHGRMDPELKAKWVAALRSGEYEQCHGALHDGRAYCCLGVLSRLMGHPDTELHGRQSNGPADVQGAVGDDPGILADMNDGTGGQDYEHTFLEIADYIEANL